MPRGTLATYVPTARHPATLFAALQPYLQTLQPYLQPCNPIYNPATLKSSVHTSFLEIFQINPLVHCRWFNPFGQLPVHNCHHYTSAGPLELAQLAHHNMRP